MTLSDQPIHKTPVWAPVLECLALVAAGVALNILVFPDDPGFLSIHPHPSLFVVIIIGLRYGFRASLISVAITTLGYAFVLLQLVEVPTYLYLLQSPYSTPTVVLVPLGVVVGLLSQRHLDKLNKVEEEYFALRQQVQSLEGEQEELRDVNLELAGRVVGAQGTVGQLYEFAKQLNVVDESKIYDGILDLLKEALGAEKSTIWRVGPNGVSFLLCSEFVDRATVVPPNFAQFDHLFDKDGVLALHDLPENARDTNLPFLSGKLRGGPNGEVVAYVALDTIEFSRYSAETVRLFGMVVEWASSSLTNAFAMQQNTLAEAAPQVQLQHGQPQAGQPQAGQGQAVLQAQVPPPAKPLSKPKKEKKRRISKKRRSVGDFVPAVTSAYTAATPPNTAAAQPNNGRTIQMPSQFVGGEMPAASGISAPSPNPAMNPQFGQQAPMSLSENMNQLGLEDEEAAEGTVHRLADIIRATQASMTVPQHPDSVPAPVTPPGSPAKKKSAFLPRSVTLLAEAGAANPGGAESTDTSTSPSAMFNAAEAVHSSVRKTRAFGTVDAHSMRTVVSERPDEIAREEPRTVIIPPSDTERTTKE